MIMLIPERRHDFSQPTKQHLNPISQSESISHEETQREVAYGGGGLAG